MSADSKMTTQKKRGLYLFLYLVISFRSTQKEACSLASLLHIPELVVLSLQAVAACSHARTAATDTVYIHLKTGHDREEHS